LTPGGFVPHRIRLNLHSWGKCTSSISLFCDFILSLKLQNWLIIQNIIKRYIKRYHCRCEPIGSFVWQDKQKVGTFDVPVALLVRCSGYTHSSSTNEDGPGSRSRSPGSSVCLLLQSQSPNADSGSELNPSTRVEIEIGPTEVWSLYTSVLWRDSHLHSDHAGVRGQPVRTLLFTVCDQMFLLTGSKKRLRVKRSSVWHHRSRFM